MEHVWIAISIVALVVIAVLLLRAEESNTPNPQTWLCLACP